MRDAPCSFQDDLDNVKREFDLWVREEGDGGQGRNERARANPVTAASQLPHHPMCPPTAVSPGSQRNHAAQSQDPSLVLTRRRREREMRGTSRTGGVSWSLHIICRLPTVKNSFRVPNPNAHLP